MSFLIKSNGVIVTLDFGRPT